MSSPTQPSDETSRFATFLNLSVPNFIVILLSAVCYLAVSNLAGIKNYVRYANIHIYNCLLALNLISCFRNYLQVKEKSTFLIDIVVNGTGFFVFFIDPICVLEVTWRLFRITAWNINITYYPNLKWRTFLSIIFAALSFFLKYKNTEDEGTEFIVILNHVLYFSMITFFIFIAAISLYYFNYARNVLKKDWSFQTSRQNVFRHQLRIIEESNLQTGIATILKIVFLLILFLFTNSYLTLFTSNIYTAQILLGINLLSLLSNKFVRKALIKILYLRSIPIFKKFLEEEVSREDRRRTATDRYFAMISDIWENAPGTNEQREMDAVSLKSVNNLSFIGKIKKSLNFFKELHVARGTRVAPENIITIS